MRLSMLTLLLTLGSSCAGHPPAPPPMTRCENVDGAFWCRGPDGKHLPPVKFADSPRLECFPLSDWEARKNWEQVLR